MIGQAPPRTVRAELVKARAQSKQPFDKLRANGGDEAQPHHAHPHPFGLSLSKPGRKASQPFYKLRANGEDEAQPHHAHTSTRSG